MDYFGIEPLLMARLRERVPGARAILSAADLAGVQEQQQADPALHVFYMGDRFGDSARGGACVEIQQTWAVVVVVRELRAAAVTRASAGELVGAVIAAVQGWQAGPDYGPLRRIEAPQPIYRPGGWCYFPLYFLARVLSEGSAT